MTPLFASRLPIIGAPMAGGPTTVALANAVARAGAFPFLAAGYKTPGAMADEIEQLRTATDAFGVNLFVPQESVIDREAFGAYAEELQPEAARHGLRLSTDPVTDDDHWGQKVSWLIAHPVPVVSFTFALPDAATIGALRAAGTSVVATVTTLREAEAARRAGVDGLIVQGPDAGGHSATHDARRAITAGATTNLVRRIAGVTALPIVAAGGVDGPRSVRALLSAGAVGVAVGTLLLRTDEAGTSPVHRDALVDPRFDGTTITRAFTGRPARALRNRFILEHGAHAPTAYPALHHLTRPLRQAAAAAGDADLVHLWAGTGYRSAPTGRAADVVGWLAGSV